MTTAHAHQHPIRNAEIRIFKSVADGEHVGRFRPYDGWPILFIGTSEDDVRAKMTAWAADVIEKNEATYAVRAAALLKARAARKDKAADAEVAA